jgi:lipid II:glycine glycyltransferase (peptidoglycan interpeptide bridge formation enzyme)
MLGGQMSLEVFNETDSKRWDDIVASSASGTLYHTWEWLRIVEKHSQSKLFPLVFFDSEDDAPFGAIPLFYMKKLGLKMVFSPPPRAAITLGPILLNKGYKQHKFELAYLEFQANIDRFIKRLGANYTSITTSLNLPDVRPFSWAGYTVSPCYTYKVDLSQGEEIIWEHLSRYLKKNIKHAEKNGVDIIKITDNSKLDYIYNSLEKRYAEKHSNFSLHKDYIQHLVEQFGKSTIEILVAIHNEKEVGALICTAYKHTLTTWVGGFRGISNKQGANELLHWRAMSNAINEGYHWFEIMGANTRHLCEFKARFCPDIFIYFHMKKADLLGSLAGKAYPLIGKWAF